MIEMPARFRRPSRRTVFDEFSKPVTVVRGNLTITGRFYGTNGVTFENVTGIFRGVIVTLDENDQLVRAELLEHNLKTGINLR